MSDAPWLDNMLSSVGVREIAGPKANEKVLAYFADVGHPECKSDEIAWCAARMGSALVQTGYPIPPRDICLMARSYCTYGVECEPKPGAIVVFPRGTSGWQGHVGCVVDVSVSKQTVKFVAGNQSDAVGYGERPIKEALCFRWPVAATVPDLRAAGSTEIKKADHIQNAGWLVSVIPAAIASAKTVFGPVDVPHFADLKTGLTWWQDILGACNAVASLVGQNPWLGGTCIVGGILVLAGKSIKDARVAKAKVGVPLSSEVHAADATGLA